jgi:hypothetical protein
MEIRRLRLACLMVIATMAVRGSIVPSGAQSLITVGDNVQVSRAFSRDMHYEVLAGADPNDPTRLLACSFLFPADGSPNTNVVYASFDGGRSWAPTLGGKELLDTSDPACTYGPNGDAYFVAAVLTQGEQRRMRLYRSKDGGRSWGSPTIFQYMDRQYVAVDTTRSPHRGRIYVNGNNRADAVSDLVVFRSTDEGGTFTGPTKRPGFGKFQANAMGNGVILSDGTLAMIFVEAKKNAACSQTALNGVVQVVTSTDGGESLSEASTVAERLITGGRKAPMNNNVATLPVLAVDSSDGPFKDRLYAAWGDQRSGRTEIWFSYSSDRGKTWAPAKAVNDDIRRPDGEPGPDNSLPALAVNRSGVLGVSWYDRRENPDNLGWNLRFTASLDGGETFLPSVRVSSAPSTFPKPAHWDLAASITGGGDPFGRSDRKSVSVGIGLRNFTMNGGDTAALVADAAGIFHPMWVDNRTGPPQLWTAPVTVAGQAMRHGSRDLTELDDVSNRLMLETVREPSFDVANATITMTVRLKNTSKETIVGPVKARIVKLGSDVGRVSVVNTENGLDGAGAVWNFTPSLRGAALGPHERSEPIVLTFRVSDLRPFQQGREFRRNFVTLETVLLGKVRPSPEVSSSRY